MAVSWSSTMEAKARLGLDPAINRWQSTIDVLAGGDTNVRTLIMGAIAQESGWNPYARRDERRADGSVWDSSFGLMQILLGTARGIDPSATADRLVNDPAYNIQLGSRFLIDQLRRYHGVPQDAIAAYNAGTARKNAEGQYVNSQGSTSVQDHVDRVMLYQAFYMNNLPTGVVAGDYGAEPGGASSGDPFPRSATGPTTPERGSPTTPGSPPEGA